ncbi:ADP-ribose pyrophosphatase, mitochondrial-like isoform X2 [Gigantopelta aegis]|nr:ADP-ribose pyrophosphatase, mitochondrial-like isoform X2 [Gigantopelta aegis]XP_041349761.1 ADP-ribose pyrophosphatase, mitochondrial-like isoform X2 [Gigantopelta aegis]
MGGRAVRLTTMTHIKARIEVYPRTDDVKRFKVPDEKVPWNVKYQEYEPPDYTAPSVLSKPPWADPDVRTTNDTSIKWNDYDKAANVNRRSHIGEYKIVDKTPRNPIGRTGLRGRGLLGRWGPNHAADPIVTRWKRQNKTNEVVKDKDGQPVLQFIAVQRRDNKEWALPGGMVDPGESVTVTIRREFSEEALNKLEASSTEKKKIETAVNALFSKGDEIYRGYVDDPRNTDNSWMETIAMNFHDDHGKSVANFKLHAGDDAVGVQWMDISKTLKLYASHESFIKETAQKHAASW